MSICDWIVEGVTSCWVATISVHHKTQYLKLDPGPCMRPTQVQFGSPSITSSKLQIKLAMAQKQHKTKQNKIMGYLYNIINSEVQSNKHLHASFLDSALISWLTGIL